MGIELDIAGSNLFGNGNTSEKESKTKSRRHSLTALNFVEMYAEDGIIDAQLSPIIKSPAPGNLRFELPTPKEKIAQMKFDDDDDDDNALYTSGSDESNDFFEENQDGENTSIDNLNDTAENAMRHLRKSLASSIGNVLDSVEFENSKDSVKV